VSITWWGNPRGDGGSDTGRLIEQLQTPTGMICSISLKTFVVGLYITQVSEVEGKLEMLITVTFGEHYIQRF